MATEASANFTRPLALHISNLHPDTTEQEIFQHFSQAGAIANVRILRDNETRLPRGHAYVNYLDQEEAEKALNSLNYSTLHEREIRVMRALPPSSLNPQANVHVKNLPEGFTCSRLHDVFSSYGAILSARVAQDKTGTYLQHGCVQFESEEPAKEVIQLANEGKILVAGQPTAITAEIFVPLSKRSKSVSAFTNVFVRNFPIEWTKEQFLELVGKFGKVTSAEIRNQGLVHPETKAPSKTAFGFANYSTHEEAVQAVEGLNGQPAGEFSVEAFNAQTKSQRSESRSSTNRFAPQPRTVVYCKNIPVGKLSKEEIEQHALSIPGALKVTLQTNPQGQFTGVAFITFADARAAQNGVNAIYTQYQWYASIKLTRDERIRMSQRSPVRSYPHGFPYYAGPHPYPPHAYQQTGGRRHYRSRHHAPFNGMVPIHPRTVRRHGGAHYHAHPHPHPYAQPGYYVHAQVAPAAAPPTDVVAQPQPQQERRQELGEALYYRVAAINEARAPKITGMLLEMQEDEINKLLADQSYLQDKVQEAIDVLATAGQ